VTWPDTYSLMKAGELLFKWIKFHLNSNTCNQKMHAELNNRPGEKRRSCSDVEGVLAGLSMFVCSSSFPFCSLLASVSFLVRQQLEAKWRETTGCCSRKTSLLVVHGGARFAAALCCRHM
jgi:hypothetical protein